jgi:hypothetical protein
VLAIRRSTGVRLYCMVVLSSSVRSGRIIELEEKNREARERERLWLQSKPVGIRCGRGVGGTRGRIRSIDLNLDLTRLSTGAEKQRGQKNNENRSNSCQILCARHNELYASCSSLVPTSQSIRILWPRSPPTFQVIPMFMASASQVLLHKLHLSSPDRGEI